MLFVGKTDLDQIGGRAAGRADVGHEEDRVARGLVDLDAVAVHQDLVLEGIAVEARLADVEREARGVQGELVVRPGVPDVLPAVLFVVIGGDAGPAVLLGHEVADGEHPEILAEQRMGGDLLAQHHGHLDLLLDQLEALQLDLPAADIKRGEDLVVGRGRGVGHVGFVEGLLDLRFVVLVVHVDHRALAQSGQCLVGRLGSVDPDAHAIRVGQQGAVQPGAVVLGVEGVERASKISISRAVLAAPVTPA